MVCPTSWYFWARHTKTNVEQTGAVRWPLPGRSRATDHIAFANPWLVDRSIRSPSRRTSNGIASRPSCGEAWLHGMGNFWGKLLLITTYVRKNLANKQGGQDSFHSPLVTLISPEKHSKWSKGEKSKSLTWKSRDTMVANTSEDEQRL